LDDRISSFPFAVSIVSGLAVLTGLPGQVPLWCVVAVILLIGWVLDGYACGLDGRNNELVLDGQTGIQHLGAEFVQRFSAYSRLGLSGRIGTDAAYFEDPEHSLQIFQFKEATAVEEFLALLSKLDVRRDDDPEMVMDYSCRLRFSPGRILGVAVVALAILHYPGTAAWLSTLMACVLWRVCVNLAWLYELSPLGSIGIPCYLAKHALHTSETSIPVSEIQSVEIGDDVGRQHACFVIATRAQPLRLLLDRQDAQALEEALSGTVGDGTNAPV
jgi:hypothetical protein